MTPRGVEHQELADEYADGDGVEESMTPRGVEHANAIIEKVGERGSGGINDAERR